MLSNDTALTQPVYWEYTAEEIIQTGYEIVQWVVLPWRHFLNFLNIFP